MLPLVFALSALAADHQLWSVHGVAANDTLNVRKDPNASSSVVGTFAPNETGIEELDQDESGWFKVQKGQVTGWVNGSYLAPEAPAELPANLTCTGTEPFWSFSVHQGKATLTTPERPKGTTVQTRSKRATQDPAWMVATSAKGAGFSWFTVRLDEATCSDGMSSRRYPYGALGVTRELGFVAGCCRIADDPQH